MNLYLFTLFRDPLFFLASTLLIVFSICCHEFMHAFMALKFGDSTAADAGHLTLNPLRQMGWFSLLMLAILGIAWGQVPVNPDRMRGKYAPFSSQQRDRRPMRCWRSFSRWLPHLRSTGRGTGCSFSYSPMPPRSMLYWPC